MSEFKVGMDVKVIDVVNMYGVQGEDGYILAKAMGDGWIVKVFFPGTQSDEFALTEDQMYPTPATATPTGAPAAAGAGDVEPRTDLDADTLERWPRLIWDRMTKPEFEGFYTDDHGRNDILDLLEVIATQKRQLAAARQQVAACQRALTTVFSEAQVALIDLGGFVEKDMPADKQVLFRVFRVVDSALQAASADGEGG